MRKALPIRTRLTLLVLATALPLVALIAYNAYSQTQQESERATAEALRAARAVATEAENMLRGAQALLDHLAQQPLVSALDDRHCDAIFGTFRGLFPYYTNLFTVRSDGIGVCSAIPRPPDTPSKVDPTLYLDDTLRTRTFTVGHVTRGLFTGRWILIVARPLPAPQPSAGTDIPGVIALTVNLSALRLAPGPGELPPQALARIVDAKGSVIGSSLQPDEWIGQSLAHIPWFKRLVPGREATGQSPDYAGVQRIFGVVPIRGTQWHAAVGIPVDVVYGPVRDRLLLSAGLATLALTLAAVLAYFTARRTAAPVEAMAAAARRATASPHAASLDSIDIEGAPGEVQALADDFRSMLEARAAAELALRESEESLATTLHSIGDAVIATDAAGTVTRINAAAERLTGWPAAHAIGQPLTTVFRIVNAQTRAPMQDPVQRVLANDAMAGLANHTTLLSRAGHEYQISDSAAAIRDAQGRIAGVVLVFSDVTEQYRVLQALRQREERQRDTGELARVAGWELDIATMKTSTSDEMCF
ncbi:MAG: PAS domain-containing protein, partial [Rhizobacter sp.]